MKKYTIYLYMIVILIIFSIGFKLNDFIILQNNNIEDNHNYLISYAFSDLDDTIDECDVTVIDIVKPIIKYKSKLTTTEGKKINLLKNVTVTDNSGESIKATVEGNYDFNKPGTYKLKYVAMDSSNNRTEESFTLVVKKKIVVNTINVVNTSQSDSTPTPIPSSGLRKSMVNIADSQIGNYNGNKFWSWYGFKSRVDWCGVFVSWVANNAGALNSYIPKFARVVDFVNYYKSNGLWKDKSYTPNTGDLIFFDWTHNGRADHVGIVEYSANGKVYVIEGNTKYNDVRKGTYPINGNMLYGYGIPRY